MTGYGRGEAALGEGQVRVELRTVNARFLDVRLRLPRELTRLEASLRAIPARFFKRGQVDVSVRLASVTEVEPGVGVNFEAARSYLEAARELAQSLDLQGSLSASELLELPGVVQTRDAEFEETAVERALSEALEKACEQAVQMRRREGQALENDLRGRLAVLEDLVNQIEARAEDVKSGLRERLEKRLASLAPDVEIEPARLAQEVVMHVDRMDVTEETVRLRSHMEQFRETLESAEPVGRKLEFLLQEAGREANTIGSKAGDAPVSRQVVALKTELEKLREQILNLE